MSEIINIPDENFRNRILKELRKPSDYEITKDDCESITHLYCIYSDIISLKGIEYFTNLTYLWCYNNKLTNLDISKNILLKQLYCENNQLTSLDLSKNVKLKYLDCSSNQLTSLDVSENTLLNIFNCKYNKIKSLDLSKNVKLTDLQCSNNKLTSLDLSRNIKLLDFSCNNNKLKMFILNDFIQKIINYTPVITNFKNITIEI